MSIAGLASSLLANVSLFKKGLGIWGILGFVAQAVFAARFLYQWVASERRRHSYVPVGFWWISLSGGVMMLVYGFGLTFGTDAGLQALPVVLGQASGLLVYSRNLILIYRKRRVADAQAIEAGDALYIHSDQNPPGAPSGDAGECG